MASHHFYTSVNGETTEVTGFYAPSRKLTDVTGTLGSGVGNVTAFNDITFFDYITANPTGFENILDGNLTITDLKVTATASYYTVSFVFNDETEQAISISGNTELTRSNLNTLGITAVALGSATAGDDIIELTPDYGQSYPRKIAKIYSSVNGQTKLIFKPIIGTVVYYTDSGNTQTATARIFDASEVNNLCNTSNNTWTATIDGVSITNNKIKEVHLAKSGITQIPTGFLYYCAVLDTLELPSTMTYIGQYFLNECSIFNQPIDLTGVTFIGDHFLHECDAFNQNLTIPSSVQTISTYFMYRVPSMTSTITVEAPATVISSDDHTLSSLTATSPQYSTGITLAGTYANDWKTKFPDRILVPYRKLIIAS